MARKPIHLQAAGKLTPRDRIWAAIRGLRRFSPSSTFAEIADYVVKHAPAEAVTRRIDEDTIKTYVESLVKGDYLRRMNPKRGARYEPADFALLRDVGIEAPRVTRGGKTVTQGGGREALWRSMKILKTFTRGELAQAASTASNKVGDEEASTYVYYLVKAGYVIEVKPGKSHHPARYRFLAAKNTGPRAPMIQRVRHVYDPNLGVVVWHPEANA
jgi:hypothetical protein